MQSDEGFDELIIDSILSNPADYRKIANEWQGTSIQLTEMEPSVRETQNLSQWEGNDKKIKLYLCGHEHYNLEMFVNTLKIWKGHLVIGYSGPDIFTQGVANAFKDSEFTGLTFRSCDFPEGFIDHLNTILPDTFNIIIDDSSDSSDDNNGNDSSDDDDSIDSAIVSDDSSDSAVNGNN